MLRSVSLASDIKQGIRGIRSSGSLKEVIYHSSHAKSVGVPENQTQFVLRFRMLACSFQSFQIYVAAGDMLKDFKSGDIPEIKYSFLPLASRVTPQTADTGAVKTASMSWLGPLNIWNRVT